MAYSAMRKAPKLANASSRSTANSTTYESPVRIDHATDIGEMVVNVSAIAGSSAGITVFLQHSPDGGQTWVNTGLTTSSLTATGAVRVAVDRNLFPLVRVGSTLTNTTTPTATFTAWLGYSAGAGALPIPA